VTVRREVGVRGLLGPATLTALAVGAVCVVVGAVVSGVDGLGAALLGLVLVLGFLLVGQLPVAQAARGRGGLGAFLLLLGYLSRVLLLLVVFVLVTQAGAPDREVLGITVITVALGWTAGTVWTWLHWRGPVVDVDLPSDRDSADR
jgi:hypothetical protein